jgi:hypothetical protein
MDGVNSPTPVSLSQVSFFLPIHKKVTPCYEAKLPNYSSFQMGCYLDYK